MTSGQNGGFDCYVALLRRIRFMVDRNDRRCTAFHEAGHAVACIKHGIKFEYVYIKSEAEFAARRSGEQAGEVRQNFHLPTLAGVGESGARPQIIQSFAGPIAEALAYEGIHPLIPSDDGDLTVARKFAKFAICQFQIDEGNAHFDLTQLNATEAVREQVVQNGRLAAEAFVACHAGSITAFAEALLDRGRLTHDEAVEICESHERQASS